MAGTRWHVELQYSGESRGICSFGFSVLDWSLRIVARGNRVGKETKVIYKTSLYYRTDLCVRPELNLKALPLPVKNDPKAYIGIGQVTIVFRPHMQN